MEASFFKVKVYLEPGISEDEKAVVEFAINLHNSQLGEVLKIVDDNSNADITISFLETLEQFTDQEGALGHAKYNFDGQVNIYISSNSPKSWCTVAHELGHAMGHDFHVSDPTSLMYRLNSGCGVYISIFDQGFLNYEFYSEFKDWFQNQYSELYQ